MKTTAEATFEATYVRYPFAPLVRLAIELGTWLSNLASDARHDRAVGEAA